MGVLVECFRTVSFQKVVKPLRDFSDVRKGFRTVSFQKVVKHFTFIEDRS